MNKEDIIKTIDKYKLDKTKFIVISGAALVLQGIISKTHDIDIWCNKEYYDYLLKNYNCEFDRVNEFGKTAYMIDEVINFGVSFKPNKEVLVNNIRCSSLEDILELKRYLNRDKDKKIIDKLQNIMKRK